MVAKANFAWKKYIDEALNTTDYCSIATVDEKGVWSNPVYFAWDKGYNFYFISQMTSRHGRAGHGPDAQGYIDNPIWLYVKITPEQIYYFDTRFFEEDN